MEIQLLPNNNDVARTIGHNRWHVIMLLLTWQIMIGWLLAWYVAIYDDVAWCSETRVLLSRHVVWHAMLTWHFADVAKWWWMMAWLMTWWVMVRCLGDLSGDEAGGHGKGEMAVEVECWWYGAHDWSTARGPLDYPHGPDQVKSDPFGWRAPIR